MDKDVGRLRWLSLILLVVVTYAVYKGSLSNLFHWDDRYLILDDCHIRTLKNIPRFFGLTYWREEACFPGSNFRPLRTTSFAIDYFFWGYNPFGYHLTNLLFHIFNVLLVYYFVHLLLYQASGIRHQASVLGTSSLFALRSSLVALLSALLFAVHPIHTEAVCWIKNRSELFCTFFFLYSLILFIESQTLDPARKLSVIRYPLSVICFVLALLSKETAITLPMILVFYLYFFLIPGNLSLLEKGKRIFFRTLPFWAIGILYIVLRFSLLRIYVSIQDSAPILNPFSHTMLVVKTVGEYLKLLILPVALCAERFLRIPRSIEQGVLLSLGVVIFFLVTAVALFRRGKLFSFALFWIFFTVLPAGNIVPVHLSTRPFAEQRLYLTSVGFCILLALLFAKALKRNNAITQKTSQQILRLFGVLAVFSVLAAYSVGTVRRVADWGNLVVFWEKTVKSSPEHPRARVNLGLFYESIGRNEEAVQQYKKAIEIAPKLANAYFCLGALYAKLGRTNEATAMLEKFAERVSSSAVKFDGYEYARVHGKKGKFDLADGQFAVGFSLKTRGLSERAIAHFKEALKYNPDHEQAHYHLAETYEREKQYEQAIFHYQRVIEIKPGHPGIHTVYINLGNIYQLRGEPDKAIAYLEKAVKIKSNFLEVRKNLAGLYKEKGMDAQAITQYKEILRINPKDWDAYFNLGFIYMEKGLLKESIEQYKEGIKHNPNVAEVRYNLGLVYLGVNRFRDAAEEFKKTFQLQPEHTMAEKMYQFALESAKQGDLPRDFRHP